MAIGDPVAQAIADLFGATLAEGGYLAGAMFSGALFTVFVILSARFDGPPLVAFGALLMGSMVSVMVGWWPYWTMLITGFLFLVFLVAPFGGRSSGGL